MCGSESNADRGADVTAPESKQSGSALRWSLLLVVVAVVAGGAWATGGGRVATWMIQQADWLEKWAGQHAMLAGLAALGAYVVVAGFSVPVATLLSLALGRILGFWPALAVVSFGSTIGATLAMVVSRTLLRESVVKRLGPKGQALLRGLERNGTFYLFTLRMMPQVPFVLVNLGMGLSSIRVWTFFWISQLGMLPATVLYVFTGSQLPSLAAVARGDAREILTWPLMSGLVLLGLFPLAVRLCWPGTGDGESAANSEETSS